MKTNMNKKLQGGIALGIIAGILSIFIGILMPIYFMIEMPIFIGVGYILLVLALISGIMTIVGSIIVLFNVRIGKIIGLIGTLIILNIVGVYAYQLIRAGEQE